MVQVKTGETLDGYLRNAFGGWISGFIFFQSVSADVIVPCHPRCPESKSQASGLSHSGDITQFGHMREHP